MKIATLIELKRAVKDAQTALNEAIRAELFKRENLLDEPGKPVRLRDEVEIGGAVYKVYCQRGDSDMYHETHYSLPITEEYAYKGYPGRIAFTILRKMEFGSPFPLTSGRVVDAEIH
ncbi:MAG: hypothetical protein IE916_00385 [Epsilonproteobacteria bacterium]|nr:hypothetical protein [Campylobacterales bacterium]MBD3822952.1 hypothetical protein [Campylobacterota bacterium]